MSGEGAPPYAVPVATGLRLGVVAADWHADVVDLLLDRALAVASRAGTAAPTVVRVAGSLEIPVVAAELGRSADAVVALGLVLRGETAHFDHVCRVVADGCARVALDLGVPVGQGVLMCDTLAQAFDRSGRPGAREDKGAGATVAALRTAVALAALRRVRRTAEA